MPDAMSVFNSLALSYSTWYRAAVGVHPRPPLKDRILPNFAAAVLAMSVTTLALSKSSSDVSLTVMVKMTSPEKRSISSGISIPAALKSCSLNRRHPSQTRPHHTSHGLAASRRDRLVERLERRGPRSVPSFQRSRSDKTRPRKISPDTDRCLSTARGATPAAL